ncbi:hypothetical protein [Martelella sp. UBA3392]|uniref:hypothetical protein n=1 Tax=Martelella sp. UBA3392 TaxID=1946834 RepID=UPI0031F52385
MRNETVLIFKKFEIEARGAIGLPQRPLPQFLTDKVGYAMQYAAGNDGYFSHICKSYVGGEFGAK